MSCTSSGLPPRLLQQDQEVGEGAPLWGSLRLRWGAGYIHRQEYWSGLPFPSLGDLSKLGIKPESPALAGTFFTTESLGKPQGKNSKRQKCKPLWVLSHTLAFILTHLGVSQKPAHL